MKGKKEINQAIGDRFTEECEEVWKGIKEKRLSFMGDGHFSAPVRLVAYQMPRLVVRALIIYPPVAQLHPHRRPQTSLSSFLCIPSSSCNDASLVSL